MTEEALFQLALNTPVAERPALLDHECAGNPALRARVEARLAADARTTPYIGSQTDEYYDETRTYRAAGQPGPVGQPPANDTAGAILAGKYTLVEAVGEGGMGSVWMARQSEPVKRTVAVKLIKRGMDSRNVLARFDAERQALAMMDHPNIAKVFDGGLTPDGRPFFVMELVQGVPITEFCDARKLTPHQRLELFVPVCEAIQHAHQKGIIHRDIKPSNVLVALYDDRPIPKVIDFGIAKATGTQLTEQTIDTGVGGVVGTPQYMSPEQATFNNLDVDTRSDVYSLGVLLYELLAGSPPFSSKELKKAGLMEVLRVVREEDPPRPSTKLSSADALPSISANRGIEPKKLMGLLRNELDWIAMKALEKDRTRRYETANGFAADVKRYLSGEPVQAHPPSRGYRLTKFLRKNRGPVVAAGLVGVALLAGIVGTTVGLFEAHRQTEIADNRRQDAETAATAEKAARGAEKTAKEEAQASLKKMEKGVEILGSIFKGLNPGRAEEEGKALPELLGERLDRATKELEGDAVGDPVAVARLQVILGESQLGLGFPEKAIALCLKAHDTLTASLGPNHRDTLLSAAHLAASYLDAGQYKKALPVYEETLAAMKTHLGPDDPDTLSVMNSLADGYRTAKLETSVPLALETVKAMKAKYSPDHPDVLRSVNTLALSYMESEQFTKALPLLEELLTATKAKFSPDHPETLGAMGNLASAYKALRQYDQALPLYEETLKVRKAKLGPDHPKTLECMNNLAMGYHVTGQLDKAMPLYEATLTAIKAKSGPDHPNTLSCTHNLAKVYLDAKKPDEAVKLIQTYVAGQRKQLGAESSPFPFVLAVVGNDLLNAQQFSAAEPYIRESVALREKNQPNAWNTFNSHSMLGEVLLRQQKYAEAEPLLLKGYEGMKQREKTIPPQASTRIPNALDQLVAIYTATNKPDEVKKWQAERVKYPAAKQPSSPEKK